MPIFKFNQFSTSILFNTTDKNLKKERSKMSITLLKIVSFQYLTTIINKRMYILTIYQNSILTMCTEVLFLQYGSHIKESVTQRRNSILEYLLLMNLCVTELRELHRCFTMELKRNYSGYNFNN